MRSWIGAVFLLPACWAVARALGRTLPVVFRGSGGGLLAPAAWALIAGAVGYGIWHRRRPPVFLHVFFHEATHALFGLLLGKKLRRFQASRRGGRVTLSGANSLIALAPYIFPLPAFGVVLAAGPPSGRRGAGGSIPPSPSSSASPSRFTRR